MICILCMFDFLILDDVNFYDGHGGIHMKIHQILGIIHIVGHDFDYDNEIGIVGIVEIFQMIEIGQMVDGCNVLYTFLICIFDNDGFYVNENCNVFVFQMVILHGDDNLGIVHMVGYDCDDDDEIHIVCVFQVVQMMRVFHAYRC
mgnify:CR=1 FL=1